MRNKLKFGDFIIIGVVLVMAGALAAGDALPSMRLLAKELRISVITTKRAYEELERDGFLENVPGKGCFVALRTGSCCGRPSCAGWRKSSPRPSKRPDAGRCLLEELKEC